jgi:CRISPR-associated protein Csy2
MYNYLLLPQLEVRNANAQPVWWIIGPPAITSYVGFAQALALKLGIKKHLGIAVVHHDIQFLGEQWKGTFHPQQFRAAGLIDKDDYSSKNEYALSTQPSARCHLRLSLIIRFHEDDKLDQKFIKRFLTYQRLAGGTIVDYQKFRNDGGEEVSCICGSLEEVYQKIRSGFCIKERQDLMQDQQDHEDNLDVLLRQTRYQADHQESWIMPSQLGYRLLSPIEQRLHVRDGLPHAYAEPLVGLVQYRSLRQEKKFYFWQYQQVDAETFIVTHQ